MLNLETSGIYHTDFPQYIRILTEDSFLESVAWEYMHWFYGQLDTVFVNSEEYQQSWIDRGIDAAKLKILPRGLDTELFHPERRDPHFWKISARTNGAVRPLVCWAGFKGERPRSFGRRLSPFAQKGLPVQLFFVGHGPYSETLAEILARSIFYRLSEGHGVGHGVRFIRYLCFSQHHRYVR